MPHLTDKDILHMLDTIPQRLRAARIEAGMTQEEVALQVGVSRPAISQYESGTSEISVENILRLSQVLDISVCYLLGVSTGTISNLPPTVQEVISLMEKMTQQDRGVMLRLASGLLQEE